MTTADRRRMWADPQYVHRLRTWEPPSGAVTSDLLQPPAPQPGRRLLEGGYGSGAATAAALVGPGAMPTWQSG